MIEIRKKTLQDYRFIDLFAGLGGFHLALSSMGAHCVYANEWDIPAQKVYNANFHIQPEGDITKVDESKIPDHEILCAGFPCQAFSISGNQRGFNDSRGTLFFDVARIVRAKMPKVVFMENVKNFASHDNGRTLQVVKKTMEDLGYNFFYKVLSAVDFNIPQKRERIYMVCFREDLGISFFNFPQKMKLTRHVEDFLLPESNDTKALVVKRDDMSIKYEQVPYSTKPIRIGFVNKGGQGERIYSTKGIAVTLSAYGGGAFAKTGGYLVNGEVRKLHPRECARIMGYPDSYIIYGKKNQAYKQFGNSVVVDVLQYILVEISNALEHMQKYPLEENLLTQAFLNLE